MLQRLFGGLTAGIGLACVPLLVFAQTTSLQYDITEVSGAEDEVLVNVWTSVTPSTLGSATIDVLFDHTSASFTECPSPQNTDLSGVSQFDQCFSDCLGAGEAAGACGGGCAALPGSYSTFSCDNPSDGLVRITITANTNMGDNVNVSVGGFSQSYQIIGLQVGNSEGTKSSVARLSFDAVPPDAAAKVQVLSAYTTDLNSLSIGFYQSENNGGGEDVIEDDCDTQGGGGGCSFIDTNLPVELADFAAVVDNEDIVLNWTTASETNNAGFSIEHAIGDSEEFAELAFVEGHGTTSSETMYTYTVSGLDIGRHKFRLRQIDFDGAFEYSGVVETTIELAGTHRLGAAYPNPFNPSTTFELVVGQTQHVQIDVVNALGQRVQRMFDGAMQANQPKNFVFEAQMLPTGLYFYRVAGENFMETKQMLLVK